MRIGLTYFVKKTEIFDIWSNGANQNIFFLYHLLRASPDVSEVLLINGGDGPNELPSQFDLGQQLVIHSFNDVAERLDVLIEGGAQISPAQADIVHARGGVVICYRCGNDYVIDIENMCKNVLKGSFYNGAKFDEVWTHAQHMNTCRHYWQTALRAPVVAVPHIWSPMFLEAGVAGVQASNPGYQFGYEARLARRAAGLETSLGKHRPGKSVINMEPNINVVKTSLYPMIIAELAYRQNNSVFSNLLLCNTLQLKAHHTFTSYLGQLDILKDNVVTAEARYSFPWIMTLHADVLLCHQWENSLNYAYYDALYGHYPLVHNSPFLKGIGYFYEGFDAEAGAQALTAACLQHDSGHSAYAAQCDAFVEQLLPTTPANITAHTSRLQRLLRAKRTAL